MLQQTPLFSLFSPLSKRCLSTLLARSPQTQPHHHIQQTISPIIPRATPIAHFGPSTQVRTMARKKKGAKTQDPRARMVRYALNHPLTPRPLKFGYMRYLRHWTIHRAWMLFCRNQRAAQEKDLERMYNKIREACAELEKTDLKLFRIATSKKDVGYFPIEMRIPTDTPPKGGWNHAWKKGR